MRLFTGYLLGLVAVVTTPSAYAANRLCQESRLSGFGVADLTHPKQGSVDQVSNLCNQPESRLSPEIQDAIHTIGELNGKVAASIGVTIEELIPDPIGIILVQHPLGLMASQAQADSQPATIYIGQFPGMPLTINSGVYLHELGHILSRSHAPALPDLLYELSMTPLMVETFADLLAISFTGSIISNVPTIPECMVQLRSVDDVETYQASVGYFDRDFEVRRLYECCDSLAATGRQTKASIGFCEALPQAAPRTMTPFDNTPISSEWYEKGLADPHQIGIPLNSFFIEFHRTTQIELIPWFVAALRSAQSQSSGALRCSIPRLAEVVPPVALQYRSLSDVFRELRSSLNGERQAVFDELWKKHALDFVKTLAGIDALQPGIATSVELGDRANQVALRPDGEALMKSLGCGPADSGTTYGVPYDPSLPGCSPVCVRMD